MMTNKNIKQLSEKSIFQLANTQEEKRPNILFTLIDEPKLSFSKNGKHEDPKEGIRTFGPYSFSTTTHLKEIKIGFIGTGETIKLSHEWCKKCSMLIQAKENDSLPKLFQDFSGFKELFKSDFVFNEHWDRQINRNEIDKLLQIPNKMQGFNEALYLITNKVKDISEQDSKPDIILISLPEEIVKFYRTVGRGLNDEKSRLTPAEKNLRDKLIQIRNQGQYQKNLFGSNIEIDISTNNIYQNFRRAFKAKVMKYNIPTQILLASKLIENNNNNLTSPVRV